MKTMNLKRNAKIGIAFIVSIVILYFGVYFLKGVNIFQNQNTYVARFKNVESLNVSSPILMNGFQIGLVTSIKIVQDDSQDLAVELKLDKSFKIKKGSRLEFTTDFLGGSSVNLIINPYTSEFLQQGDTIRGEKAKSMADDMNTMIPKASNVMESISVMAESLQTYITNPAWLNSLKLTEEALVSLKQSSESLKILMESLEKDVPTITQNLASISIKLDTLTTEISRSNVPLVIAKADTTITNLQNISEMIKNSEGTITKLFNDVALYDSIKSTVHNTSFLIEEIRKNPKKYLTIKATLF